MRRDFSEGAKQALLSRISEVGQEPFSNANGWMGAQDQAWIARLGLQGCIYHNVDNYYRVLSDKNNASKAAIETVFQDVAALDGNFQGKYAMLKSALKSCDDYIIQMERIIHPNNGNFTAEYITETLDGKLDEVSLLGLAYQLSLLAGAIETSEQDSLGIFEQILENLAGTAKGIGKYGGSEEATLSAAFLSYLAAACGMLNKEEASASDIVSNFLGLIKSSGKMETGLFNYYEKKLHPYEAAKLDGKFGKTMSCLSILASLVSVAEEGIDTYEIWTNPESSAYEKTAQLLEVLGSGAEFGTNAYIVSLAGSKTLQFVSNTSKNQILATSQTLKYTTSKAVTDKISKANTWLAVGKVAVSTASSSIKRFGEVTEDGELTMKDMASVGIYSSMGGISDVVSQFTLGIIDIDGEKVASELEAEATEYLAGDSWAANYVKDQSKDPITRFGVSMYIGGKVLEKKIVNGIEEGVQAIGEGVQAIGEGISAVGSWIFTGCRLLMN